jgi:very-short-patch-repair endonuclease
MDDKRRNPKEKARKLRKNMTNAECTIWRHLRNRGLINLKFRRQVPIGEYIVDFLCYEKMLIIEVDGGQHSWQQDHDQKREKFLEKQGFKVLRFWNHDVLKNINGVAEKIMEFCGDSPETKPSP